MDKLKDMGFNKVDTIIIEQYAYKNSTNIIIEHQTSNDDKMGVWKYYGVSIHDSIPKFKSLEGLLDFLNTKAK